MADEGTNPEAPIEGGQGTVPEPEPSQTNPVPVIDFDLGLLVGGLPADNNITATKTAPLYSTALGLDQALLMLQAKDKLSKTSLPLDSTLDGAAVLTFRDLLNKLQAQYKVLPCPEFLNLFKQAQSLNAATFAPQVKTSMHAIVPAHVQSYAETVGAKSPAATPQAPCCSVSCQTEPLPFRPDGALPQTATTANAAEQNPTSTDNLGADANTVEQNPTSTDNSGADANNGQGAQDQTPTTPTPSAEHHAATLTAERY
ncbi:hypothetical protein BDW62DRAFT_207249 [Aspergillus aurantiobrunneus]